MRNLLVLLFVCLMSFGAVACSKSHGSNGDPDGGDTDTDSDTDSDTDTGEEWCPELETSCEAPDALDACGDDTLNEPRLIFPLSGRHIRDRRPQIIWEEADGATQYRLEIALDRAFTDVVYRSTDYQPLGTDRFEHIVTCDLDCGVHFFRVKSVTAPECESGASSYTWEMFVGMAPGDLDRDGVPDIMYWKLIEPAGEMQPYLVQGWAFFDLDEKGGQVAEAEKVVEFEVEGNIIGLRDSAYLGDVNADGSADVSVGVLAVDAPYEFETAIIETYVFSKLRSGSLQGKDDAIRLFEGDLGQLFHVSFFSNRYSDFNGDGFSDIAISFYEDYGDPGFTDTLLVYFGTSEEDVVSDMSSADVVVPCPVGCDADTSFGRPISQIDVNGDGFSDISTRLNDYNIGIPDAGTGNSVIVFGAADPGDTTDVLSSSAIIASDVLTMTLSSWELWHSPIDTTLQSMGDVDFDGYSELCRSIGAIDTNQSPLINTGGLVILNNLSGPGQHLISDVMDTVLIGDFETHTDQWDTERVIGANGGGDIDGDLIDDLIVLSQMSDPYDPAYPGSLFYFYGNNNWESFIPLSDADEIEIGSDDSTFRMIADFDVDGINDFWFDDISGYYGILLSATGERIDLDVDFSGAVDLCGPVLPEIY